MKYCSGQNIKLHHFVDYCTEEGKIDWFLWERQDSKSLVRQKLSQDLGGTNPIAVPFAPTRGKIKKLYHGDSVKKNPAYGLLCSTHRDILAVSVPLSGHQSRKMRVLCS